MRGIRPNSSPALGITDEADLMELKGSKKKKGKKIDDPDFMVCSITKLFRKSAETDRNNTSQ
jgi:hypothetical protein